MSEEEFDLDAFLAEVDAMPDAEPESGITPEMRDHLNKMMALTAEVSEMQDALADADAFKSDAEKNIKHLIAQAQQMQEDLRNHEMKVREQRQALKRLENERENEKRALEIAQQQRDLALELRKIQDRFDLITAGAKWREFAKDHQITNTRIMATARRAILADKMGLGKTLTSLAASDMLESKKILVVCPNDIQENFQNEVRRWAPHRTPVILGGLNKAQRRLIVDMLKKMDEVIAFLNYEAWRKDLAFLDELAEVKFDTLIIDEAHKIKDIKSIASRGIFKIAFTENLAPEDWRMTKKKNYAGEEYEVKELFGGCSVRNVFPMTGTPILNRPQDLFPLVALTMPDVFGTDKYDLYRFLNMYCMRENWTNKWKFKSGGLDRLVRQMSGKYVMRDRKAAGIELPPQDVQVYHLTLDPEEYPNQYRVAQQLTKYAQIVLDEERAANILYIIALITRKRQAMTWPAGIKFRDVEGNIMFEVDVFESIKIDKCIKFINSDINEWEGFIPDFTNDGERGPDNKWTGERVVVFSQFKEALKEIERRCKDAGISVVRYDGDTPDNVKSEVKLDFDRFEIEHNGREPRWQVVLANYKTGGEGLNFNDCTQVVILDEEWNPGKRDQAYARVDRMGQTQESTVHVLRVNNSIEDWMAAIIDEKQLLIEGFETKVNLYEELKKRLGEGDML